MARLGVQGPGLRREAGEGGGRCPTSSAAEGEGGLWQPGEELPDSVPSSARLSWVTSDASFSLPLTQFLICTVEITPLLYFVGVLGR